MFVTAVCVIFLIKLRRPKNRSLYEAHARIEGGRVKPRKRNQQNFDAK